MTRVRVLLTIALLAIGIGIPSGTASAAECTINEFGGPHRFADKGAQTELDLQKVFTQHRADIEKLLGEVGWEGDSADLFSAVAAGAAEEADFPTGTPFRWMMLRYKDTAQIALDKCWGGKNAFPGWRIVVESNGYRWTFAVPKACGNLALTGSEKLPPPPPPPPPPPAPKPAAPPPPPPPAPVEADDADAAMAPAAAPFEKRCVARLFYAKAYTDDSQFVEENAGTPEFESTKAIVSNGDGFGLEGECMVTPRLGIPLTLMSISNDGMVLFDTATVWDMDSADVDWLSITGGVNYHFTKPESKIDAWVGPFIGYASVDDAKFTIQGESSTAKFDDEFVYGLQLGLDVPARDGIAFYLGLRYFAMDLEATGDDVEFELDPLVLNAGISYRF